MSWINPYIATWLFVFSLFPTISNAGSSTNKDERIISAVEKVVAEYKIYATCSALNPMFLSIVMEGWDHEVQEGVNALREIDSNGILLANFATAVAPSQLLDPNMRLSDAIEYCKTNHAKIQTFFELGASRLYPTIMQASADNNK